MTRLSRRAGVTLLEIIVATAVLGILVAAAVSSLLFASRPAAESSVRAFLATQGGQSMARIVNEVEGASFVPSQAVRDPAAGYALVSIIPATQTYEGDGLELQRITGWNVITQAPDVDPNPIRYGFIDAAGSRSLVRIQNGLSVTVLTDIDPASGPHFRLAAPATLTISFAVQRVTGRNPHGGSPEMTRVVFEQRVNLRNLNQP